MSRQESWLCVKFATNKNKNTSALNVSFNSKCIFTSLNVTQILWKLLFVCLTVDKHIKNDWRSIEQVKLSVLEVEQTISKRLFIDRHSSKLRRNEEETQFISILHEQISCVLLYLHTQLFLNRFWFNFFCLFGIFIYL